MMAQSYGSAQKGAALQDGGSALSFAAVLGDVLCGKPLAGAIDAFGQGLEARMSPGSVCLILLRADQHAVRLSNSRVREGGTEALGSALEAAMPSSQLRLDLGGLSAPPAAMAPMLLRALSMGFRSVVIEPILSIEGGEPIGVLALFSARPKAEGLAEEDTREAARELALMARAHEAVDIVNNADKRFSALAATIPGVVYQRVVRTDGEIRYTYISENAYELFGVTAERIINDPEALFRHYSPEYRSSFRQKLLAASRDMSLWDVEATILRPDGETRYTHAIARPHRQPDGSVLWTGVILDATRIKMAELAASAAEARTREAIVESLSQGLLLFDRQDRLVIVNSHFGKLYPALADHVRPGVSYREVIGAELDPARNRDVLYFNASAELAERLSRHGERHLVYEREMSGDRFLLVNEYRTANSETVVLYTDISEMKRRERKIEHLAHHDALTGLANRVLFREKLNEALSTTGEGRSTVAVMCLDLDRFKNINDTLGHQVGDVLLKQVADRIETTLRDGDLACRLGGDEFAVILRHNGDAAVLTSLAWRLLHAMAQPFELEGQSIISGTSIGIAVAGAEAIDAETLLKNADLALYRAKTDGRGTFRYFEAEMDMKAQQRRLMEVSLRGAIARGELQVHYQPLVDVHTSQIMGAEALLRWNRENSGFVPPLEFIPLAEETGLIGEIGAWVLRQACLDAMTWPDDIRVAVNISPAQFRNANFADVVKEILAETGLDPNRLELEITESMLLRNTEANLRILHDLKAIGIRVSMDDFGTGYSSLGNLRSFPFDKIKIDRSFIADLNKSPDAAAIIRAVLALGRSLGMTTTAEGVETRDQLAYLRAEGCIEVQGHYFARALTAGQLIQALEGHGEPKLQAPGKPGLGRL